jgi:hypothetical protein
MKHSARILFAFCLITMIFHDIVTVKAQQVVSTSGNHAGNGTVQLSWTIGETVTGTISSGNNILTQGMHQSKLTVTAVEELVGSGFEISAFPNPATECVHIKIVSMSRGKASDMWKDFSFQIHDLHGIVLNYNQIEDSETVIRMDSYAPSIYFLKIMDNNREVKTFKIIKQ